MSGVRVFRKGQWLTYPLPKPVDAMWSSKHTFQAASFYATALSQGYSTDESASLAEAHIHKQVYTGLVFDKNLERKLQQIMSRAETS